jgi:putative ABC transport system permease protein
MSLLDSLRIAIDALRANMLRSVLTTLGIIIGVASVIVMVAVGAGARSEVDRRINALGTNMLVVYPGSVRIQGRAGGAGTQRPLSQADFQAIRDKVQDVVAISGYLQGNAPIIRGASNWFTGVAGVHEGYTATRDWGVAQGRDFTAEDIRNGARVALLGITVAGKLFGSDDPLGQTIRIRDVTFTIVGILEQKGQSGFGRDQDDMILLPMTAARGRIVGRSAVVADQVGQIFVKFADGTDLAEAQEEITNILRQRRRVQPGAEDDFSVSNLAEFLRTRAAAMTTMSLLLGATSAIALVVGGIGIMNIMLVSVTERTREIGLRMAVGGRRRDILVQFLVEAVTLCFAGGLIGVVLGVGIASIVASSADWPVLISPDIVLLALAAAGFAGIFFGFFPARRAARLNPIDALRAE